MRRLSLLALLLCCACVTTATRIPRVGDLTLDEKIGQLFIVDAYARFMNEGSPAFRELRRQVRENHVGGVIWYASAVHDTAWITRQLQELSRVPLLVSADLESGIGMRFNETTQWPPAMAIAATGDPSFAETLGRITALESRAIGVNYIFAPVADVNVDPDNPVINTRSFGEDPHEVGRYVAAFVRGVQSQPVLASAKHFPGHGDTHVDSHRSMPVLAVDRERLERVELVPFRAAIEAKVASVMIGHLAVPALDDANVPATLSRPIIDGLLRRELGFDGLVIGDAFDMGGLVERYGAGEAAVRSLEAGSDLVLKSDDTDAAIAAVKEAVRTGRISEARIDASVSRILAAKHRVAAAATTQEEIFRIVDAPEHQKLAAEIATRAITLVKSKEGVLPLRREQRVMLVVINDAGESKNFPSVLADAIAARSTTKPTAFTIDGRSRTDEIDGMLAAANDADVVLLAFAVRAVSGAGHLRLPDVARQLVQRLPVDRMTIAVSFGSPYVVRDLPSLETYIAAYGIQPVLQTAAVRALYGETAMTGKLPVTIPSTH